MEESRNSAEKPNSPGAEQASSATGVFGQVSAAPAPAEEDLLASLLKQAAPEKPASVVTDAAAQLVPSPQPASAATPEPAPARVPGEFTRMLQALTDQKPGAAPASGRAESANRGCGAGLQPGGD